MSFLLIKKYYKISKKKLYYDINTLLIWDLILGQLTKKGKKNISYKFLINILFFLKKETNKVSFIFLKKCLNIIKPNILLYNKRKGTIILELPRFLTIEQSIKKSIQWFIKLSKKRKKKMLEMLLLELHNIKIKKGDLLKKKESIILIAEANKPFFYLLK
jgi:ribosomal protein S7